MNRIALVIPGALTTRSGGYEYDRRLAIGLRSRGWHVDVHEIAGSFPYPTKETLDRATAALASIPAGMTVIVDGLALGAMPDQAERERRRLRLVALVHQPLADAVGLERAVAAGLEAGERRALAACRTAIVTLGC